MANFTSKNICATYGSILNLGTCTSSNCLLPASDQIIVTDGCGADSALMVGKISNGVNITGPLSSCGDFTVCCGAAGGGTINAGLLVEAPTICGTTCVKSDGGIDGTDITGSTLCTSGNANVCGILEVQGEIRGKADITAFYTSDERLKTNLNVINPTSIVNGLTGYSFDWNENTDKEGSDLGVIAQDLEKVAPELVHTKPDGFKSVDYIKLIPVLIEEVKRLGKEVEALKKA